MGDESKVELLLQRGEILDGKISGQKSQPFVFHQYLAALARPDTHSKPMTPLFLPLIFPIENLDLLHGYLNVALISRSVK